MTRNEIRWNETTPVVYLLTVNQKNGTEKMMNDKTNKSLSKKQKTTKQVVVVGPPIKKKLGEMGLGKMLPNRHCTPATWILKAGPRWGTLSSRLPSRFFSHPGYGPQAGNLQRHISHYYGAVLPRRRPHHVLMLFVCPSVCPVPTSFYVSF